MKVAVLDLTLDQEEQLSGEFGVPLERWMTDDSPVTKVHVMRRVYETLTGESTASMTLRDLIAAVEMADTDEPDATPGASAVDPTLPAAAPTT